MNLILVERDEVEGGGVVRLTGPRAAHVAGVLRAEPGRAMRVGVVDGPLGVGTVSTLEAASVTLVCRFDGSPPPVPAVDVMLALPRPKVMRRLWAQLAALGVGRIILTNAERVERNYFDTHVLDEESYRPLLIEGLQQARDTRLPHVTVHRQFRKLVEDELAALVPAGVRLVAHPGTRGTVREALARSAQSRALVAIGPEGGWNAFELDLLAACGFVSVGLGPRTLRTDTATVSIVALVHEGLGWKNPKNGGHVGTQERRHAGISECRDVIFPMTDD